MSTLQTNCFIICYSIANQRSFDDVELNYQGIKEYYKKNIKVPIILVGKTQKRVLSYNVIKL